MQMLRLSNHTDEDITLQSGHVIPANGYLDIETRVADRAETDPWFAGQLRRGNLSLGEVPGEADPAPITRETVAGMKRGELVETLIDLAPDEEKDKVAAECRDLKVDDLRTWLTETLFVDF